MAVDAELERLRTAAAGKLEAQARRAAWLQGYYDGTCGIIAMLEPPEREHFRTFLSESGANWCSLIVNAVAERLTVVGFRFGSEADDDAAWAIWQANQLDADSELVQTDALVQGSGFLLVQQDDANPTGVSLTHESAMQACVLYEPGTRRNRLAGFKRYPLDPTWEYGLASPAGSVVEVLALPDRIVTWWPGDARDKPQIEPNPAGVVPLIEIVPQPRTLGWPRSELEPALPIQDRIHTTIFNRMVATDYGAFRQVWASGVKIARDVIKSADGTEVTRVTRPFDIGANRLLVSEDPTSRFGSFPESTLGGYLGATQQDAETLAAITQTPAHYFLGRMVNLAADAIKAAETGLVAKCGRRALHLGEGHEEAMRLALQLVGNPAATNTSAEVVWADMEYRSEGARVDALVKMATLGVPTEVLWEKWGASPQEIARWKELRAAEPAPAPPPAPAPTVPGTGGVPSTAPAAAGT